MSTRRQWLTIALVLTIGALIGSQIGQDRAPFGHACRQAAEVAEVKLAAIRICTEHMVGCDLSLQDIETAITVQRRALACR